jgi:MoaA/NifB/PqqE/SkfB family radical SAM enzyme
MRTRSLALRQRLSAFVGTLLGEKYMNFRRFAGLRRLLRERRASRKGKRFYCRALWGAARTNACPVILSDGDVTCGCIDYDKALVLGNVQKESMAAIWRGPRVRHLRESLLSGRLPIDKCSYCWNLVELESTPGAPAPEVRPLESVLIENTVVCNYRCTGCPIEEAGESRARKVLNLDDMRGLADQLREVGVKRIGFYNYGEPFLDRDFPAKIRQLREVLGDDVAIVTSTNGSAIDSLEKRQAAVECLDLVAFSIHGADEESMAKYQVRGSFERAYGNMAALSQLRRATPSPRVRIEWKYLLYRWTSGLERCQQAASLAETADVDLLYFAPALQPPGGVCARSVAAWEKGEALHGRYPHLPGYGFVGYQKDGYQKWRVD